MTYLLRQTRQSYWTGELTEDRRSKAHATFSRREVDTDGVSLFEVEDDAQERLVLAAYACQKMELNRLDFLHLERPEVERFGAVTPDLAMMAVRAVNPLHRLLVWAPETLSEFVEDLLARGREARRHPTTQVKEAVLALDPEGIDEPQRTWVKELQDKRACGPTSGRSKG